MLTKQSKADRSAAATEEFKVPWDLSRWVDSAKLLQWAAEDVASLDWDNPRVVAMLEKQPQFRPKMLLTLLTWAYGTGRFESAEICETFFQDPKIRDLCEDQPPSEKSVVRFRRDNRGLLRWTLLRLLKHALREKYQLGNESLPAGLNRLLDDSVVLRLDVARQIERGSSGF